MPLNVNENNVQINSFLMNSFEISFLCSCSNTVEMNVILWFPSW